MRASLLTLFVLLFLAGPVRSQSAYVPGDILVMLAPGASPDALVRDLARMGDRSTGIWVAQEVSAPMRAWLLHYDALDIPHEVMLRHVRAHRSVQIAQSNHVVEERTVPNDPQYGQQWHHQNIDSEAAWEITTGGVTSSGDTIVVCIIERADLAHADLQANAWRNQHEIAGNGIDDDANGYVDDVRGWNPTSNNDDVYSGGHGTQVAGMIGATGNNGTQVVGANWHVKMMPVHYASTQEAAVLAAYTYPLVMRRLYNSSNGERGAFIVATNASWGINYGDPEDAPLWCAMYDTLGTAGVLNCGATANSQINVDVDGDLPTGCGSDFMISVTATNAADQRTFSAYGATTIDVGAPGDNVFTTSIGGGTGSTSGTSFASPLTAGVIGLLYSAPCNSLMSLVHADPAAGALYVRQALLDGVDPVPGLVGFTVTGGRINSYNSLRAILDACGSCPQPYNLTAAQPTIGSADLSWSSAVADRFNLRYRPVGATEWTVEEGITVTHFTVDGLVPCTSYEYQLAADCDTVVSDYGTSFVLVSEGCCSAPVAAVAAVDSSSVTLQWPTVLAAGSYEIRYRTAGSNIWSQVAGGSGTQLVLDQLPTCSDLELQTRSICAGVPGEWSSTLELHTTGCGECVEGTYCTSSGGSTEYEWIEQVQIGTIDHQSGNDNGYADFTAEQGTTLLTGQTYPIVLVPGYSGFSYGERFSIYIDVDEDGSFETTEVFYQATSNATGPLSADLVIPVGTPQGQFRMRVVMRYDAPAVDGCTSFSEGETEDYCVTIELNTGVNDGQRQQATIFPNPADEQLTLLWPQAQGERLQVLDAAGRVVLQHRLTGERTLLSTVALAPGLYVYRILHQGLEQAQGRFVVAR